MLVKFFKSYFKDVDFDSPSDKGEVKVLCPFHQDTEPSASINVNESLFKCWTGCGGYNEAEFMASVKGISTSSAAKTLLKMDESGITKEEWDITRGAELWADGEFLEEVKTRLNISNDTIEKLSLGRIFIDGYKFLAIPVFLNGVLVDTRKYNLLKETNHLHKLYGDEKAGSGWLIPNDLVNFDETIYVFEGEKDMVIAQDEGLNAICLTGGANAKPNKAIIESFKDKKVVIVYDNDNAGREGTQLLANTLFEYTSDIHYIDMSVITRFDGSYLALPEKGDFADFVKDYGGSGIELLIQKEYPLEREEIEIDYTSINEAMNSNIVRKEITTKVVVTGAFDGQYTVPEFVKFTKEHADDDGIMEYGEVLSWNLEEWNVHQILGLIEVDAKTKQLTAQFQTLAQVPKKEKGVKVEYGKSVVVHKALVTDVENDGNSVALEVYSFEPMYVGNQYEITYKLQPHPNKHQRIVGVATSVKQVGDSKDFKTDVQLLQAHKGTGTVEEQLDRLYQSTKHYVAPHMNYNIWLMTDLVFHSLLDFDYGGVMRGALDVFLLGDTQVGKSETTSKMTELYSRGHFISLKTSTTVGLIGGANQVNGSWVNTIGAIPRQHKKLVVLEEFSGAQGDFIKHMTDIRSSNTVRISRASGELIAPCKVRMLTVSNPINDENGNPRTLHAFPNGVIPIMELIKSAEDVTRYDGFLLCPKPTGRFNPFAPENQLTGTPIEEEVYKHKIEWVFSRGVENLLFDEGVQSYIWEKAEYLNSLFETNVPIFGTTTSKKLARFSVAMASLLTSTDDSYENIIVKKEHVDYIVKWLTSIYTSDNFRLDKVKKEYEGYSVYTPDEMMELQDLYNQNATILDHLGSVSDSTRYNLQMLSGIKGEEFTIIFNALVKMKAVKVTKTTVLPSEKFRKMYEKLDKSKTDVLNKRTSSEDIKL